MRHVRSRKRWQLVLAAMLVPLAIIAFWPSPVDQPIQSQLTDTLKFLHSHGIPSWFDYNFAEASANVALFIPLGIVSSLALQAKQWWHIGAFGLMISCCMELGQLLFLDNRFASPLDLVTNSSGAVIGHLLAAYWVRKLEVLCLPAEDL